MQVLQYTLLNLKTKLLKGIQNNSQLRFHQGCFKREIQVAEKTQEFQH